MPRFALSEKIIGDFIGKQENIGTRAKIDRDVTLLKQTPFSNNLELRKGKRYLLLNSMNCLTNHGHDYEPTALRGMIAGFKRYR